ncbi:MAG: hypothetical protein HY741_29600 [Chloroflexi bacterium]|nr:hypothetical protein [Chloroflexota bacterium]
MLNVRSRQFTLFAVALLAVLLALSACGSPPATMNDIPAYPGATALDPNIANTLAKNMQQDAALRQSMGVGGKIEQKGYSVPKDATWDQVKGFYADKLKGAGWETNSMVSNIMAQANAVNTADQTEMWKKGNQTLTLILPNDPTKNEKQLLLSLATN